MTPEQAIADFVLLVAAIALAIAGGLLGAFIVVRGVQWRFRRPWQP